MFWADKDHMVTILSADQQVANVAAVAFIIHIPAGSKQIQSMAGLLNMLMPLKFILVGRFMVFQVHLTPSISEYYEAFMHHVFG